MDSIDDYIKLRKELGLTQVHLALRMGINSRQTVGKIENGMYSSHMNNYINTLERIKNERLAKYNNQ